MAKVAGIPPATGGWEINAMPLWSMGRGVWHIVGELAMQELQPGRYIVRTLCDDTLDAWGVHADTPYHMRVHGRRKRCRACCAAYRRARPALRSEPLK